ncbi:MAG: copper oxidase [Geobacter sp.]|nr:MAG: copper oxidase [Geobacter sp.]
MKKIHLRWHVTVLPVAALTLLSLAAFSPALAVPVPGGTLDPLSIPKYVTPLVIPPEMPKSVTSPAPAADYDIAVRQFKQQILPGGVWGPSFPNPLGTAPPTVGPFPATTVWSYGRAADSLPDSTAKGGGPGIAPAPNSSFNYPAFTVEAVTATPTKVRWINDLVTDPIACAASADKTIAACNFLPHLFSVDQTLHWANPPKANCMMMPANRTDCHTEVAAPYTGPVPIVTHVHGSHVQPHSDGYPEAWWLPGTPGTKGIPVSYAERGSVFTQSDNTNTVPGSAFYSYENTQPATTLWYHDHSLGLTRLNVYAGPAGFWLLRGGSHDTAAGVLPGPAPSGTGDPNFTTAYRNTIREIPVVIQDRSFNTDGTLFFPATRTFFDGFTGPFIGGTGTPTGPSDISGIWNPEAFFNTMVVNGTTWPQLNVAPVRYRLRLLNGCNARTLNLSMFVMNNVGADGKPGTADDTIGPDLLPATADDPLGAEIPIYQIGGDQGFLPNVVKIVTGSTTTLPGNGTVPAPVAAPDLRQALLMGPAERADVIVDFTGLPAGTRVRMINTAPDAPFGGFPPQPFLPGDVADPQTTGQVMDFVIGLTGTDTTTTPQNIVLPAEASLGATTNTRQVSLNELSSDQVCVEVNIIDGAIISTLFSTTAGDPNFLANCAAATVGAGNFPTPMGPRMAQLGVLTTDGMGNVMAVPKKWGDAITETPALNSTEVWEIYNTTMDAHPIHLHLVRFAVVDRQNLDMVTMLPVAGTVTPPLPNELGYKDTVIAYPSQITRIKAKFDIAGLYVWHCHIIDHEDNEMMRSYTVIAPDKVGVYNSGTLYLDMNGNSAWDGTPTDKLLSFNWGFPNAIPVNGDWTGTGVKRIGFYSNGTWYLDLNDNGIWDGTPTDAMYTFGAGLTGAVPVTGNWTGTGATKIGVYDNGIWYVDLNGNGAWDGTPTDGQYYFGTGLTGAVPVTGDWAGTGASRIGVYDNGTWYVDLNGNGAWDGTPTDAMHTFGAGLTGALPVTGDWTATNSTKVGVYDNGTWYVDLNGNGAWDGTPTDGLYYFGTGLAGALPVAGKW